MTAGPSELLTLAIETSNPSSSEDPARGAGVCVGLVSRAGHGEAASDGSWVRGARVLAAERLDPSGPGAGEDALFPAIDRALKRAGASPRDLRLIAASVGPGGYTGVRVACAAAKMLCEGTAALAAGREDEHCRCVSVPTAIVAAMTHTSNVPRDSPGAPGSLRVALASKQGSAWISAPLNTSVLRSPRLIELARLPGSIHTAENPPPLSPPALLLHDRFLPATLHARLRSAGWNFAPLALSPEAVLEAAAWLDPIDPAHLNPLYPREPDAVTLWRQRHGGTSTGGHGSAAPPAP